ncbi:hypothetical protein X975_22710, partial [Stegodyphus mimosarum]
MSKLPEELKLSTTLLNHKIFTENIKRMFKSIYR